MLEAGVRRRRGGDNAVNRHQNPEEEAVASSGYSDGSSGDGSFSDVDDGYDGHGDYDTPFSPGAVNASGRPRSRAASPSRPAAPIVTSHIGDGGAGRVANGDDLPAPGSRPTTPRPTLSLFGDHADEAAMEAAQNCPFSTSPTNATYHSRRARRSLPNGSVFDTLCVKFLNVYSRVPLLFIIVVALSVFTRMWQIPRPNGIVFDEVHFGGFVQDYMKGNYFFDIHPPLAKLTMTFLAYWAGYDPEFCDYRMEGTVPYDPRCKYWILRYIAASFGVFVPIIAYGIARELGISTRGAAFAACLVIFDIYNAMEARCILTDSQLMFHCALAFYVGLRWWKRLNREYDEVQSGTGKPMSRLERAWWCLLVGLTCGAAVSVKWTALATPGMIAVESFFAIWFLHVSVRFVDMLGVAAVVLAQYSLWFWFHFWMLPNAGEGDNYMPVSFQRTLIGNRYYDPEAPPASFFPTMFNLNKDMLFGSASINTPHAWESKYYQWVVNSRGVLYHGEPFGPQPGLWSAMYLIGNPLVVWGCGIMIIVFVVSAFLYIRYRRIYSLPPRLSTCHTVCCYLFLGWLFNLLPYIAVTRQAFAYHYMPGLYYAQLLSSMWLDKIFYRYNAYVFGVLIIPVVLTYIFFSPWIYSLPLTPDGHEARRWLKTWD